MKLTLAEILFKTQLQFHIDVNTDSKHFKVKKVVNCIITLQNVCVQFIKYLQKIYKT